jgi:glycogen synthase
MTWREGQSLRVAVLSRSVYPLHRYGGLERHVFDLVRCLLARDVRITLITPPASRDRPTDPQAESVFRHPQLTLNHVPYVTFPLANRRGTTILDRSTAYPLFGWRAGRVASRLSAAGEVDIVHGLGASVLGYAVAERERKVPLVFNPQGLEEFGATDPARAPLKRLGYAPLRAAVRRCATAADRVIATDRALVGPVKTHLHVPDNVVRIIPNAVELADCDRPDSPSQARAVRERAGLESGDVLLLSAGRLEANKGFGILVRALAHLSNRQALPGRWRWALVGDGPMRSDLQGQIAAAALQDRAILQGRVDSAELHGWYEAATLEAMAHRKPIVATRAGGLPDKVVPGRTGWLVPPGDAEALAGAIREAISDRSRLEIMGAAGRSLVEKEFSWRVATDRLLDVYGELMAHRGSL